MMNSSSVIQRKAKISLNDYPFHREIEGRLFLSSLSDLEVEVLKEIINHSLKISVEQLADELDLNLNTLNPVLDRFAEAKIVTRQHLTLVVDKEKRKYFEAQIEKFETAFRPDMEYFLSLIGNVPIHLLPTWYALPRCSDTIFKSIIENYFITPKIYRQYINDLRNETPIFKAIIETVFQGPHFTVTVEELLSKTRLSHKLLEESLLLLEYHFICCLSYQKKGDKWEEVVTPFAEWRELLEFEYQTQLKPLPRREIKKDQQDEFAFIKSMSSALKGGTAKKGAKNSQAAAEKLVQLGMAKCGSDGKLLATSKGTEWLALPLTEQVMFLANDPLNCLSDGNIFSPIWNVRNLQLIEKSLRRLRTSEWVETDIFLQGIIAPICDREPISLKKKGKKWCYNLPAYNQTEKAFIEKVIIERFVQLNIIETGTYQQKRCFCLTPFGSQIVH